MLFAKMLDIVFVLCYHIDMRNPEGTKSQEPVSTPNYGLRRLLATIAIPTVVISGYETVKQGFEWINEKEVIATIDTAVKQGSNAVNTVCGATEEWAEKNNIDPEMVNGCVEAGQKAGKEITELNERPYVYAGDGITVTINQTRFGKLRATYIADASATK